MRAALRDPEIVYRRRWVTLLVLCISLIVITLDNTILNVAIPTLAHPVIRGGLGATASQLQWIVDSYVLVFAGQPRGPLRSLPLPRLRARRVRDRLGALRVRIVR
jgi:MFS family permease